MKKENLLRLSLVFIAFILIRFDGIAQIQAPQPSPSASVSRTVGMTKISIDYSSPGVKGREIWGKLEEYGKPWRAGANGVTKLTVSTGVKIGDKDLRAGSYSIYITPNEKGAWQVHINKQSEGTIGRYYKDGKLDIDALVADVLVTVDVEPVMLDEVQERLKYDIDQDKDGMAKVTMMWEKVAIPFMIDTKYQDMVDRLKSSLE